MDKRFAMGYFKSPLSEKVKLETSCSLFSVPGIMIIIVVLCCIYFRFDVIMTMLIVLFTFPLSLDQIIPLWNYNVTAMRLPMIMAMMFCLKRIM
mmetsp:Transcript_1118/g.1236  ORF Transcript_1118/g.1236 Transcript_1118/m.1236 type:complete len:94 (-) Transcript_1118:21-302(-)